MSKIQYFIVITPLIIIGYYITYNLPASKPYAIFILLILSYYFGWKDVRKKIKQAKGEEEIRHIIVPIILLTVVTMIGILSFIV